MATGSLTFEIPSLATPRPPASAPGEKDLETLHSRWSSSRSPKDFSAVLDAAAPTIAAGARSFAGSDNPLVQSRARLLAADAIRSYKPGGPAKLKSWLMTNLHGLTRYRQQLSTLPMPERVGYDLSTLRKAETDHEQEHGRPPSVAELQDRTGFSAKRIAHLRRHGGGVVHESQLTDEEGANYLPGTDINSPQSLWAEMVYHDLPDTDRLIYDMSLGRNGHKPSTPAEMAAKLNVSVAAVSQRTRRIADRLESFHQLPGGF